MTVGLWKIAQHSAVDGIEFLGQQTNVIAAREQTIEQPPGFLITTLQYVVVDEPKTAEQKCSFAGRQAVNGIFSLVTQNEFIVYKKLLLNGLKRSTDAGVGGWKEPNKR